MPAEVVFVRDPAQWALAFKSHSGTLGVWMNKTTLKLLGRVRLTAPQPGVPPRNRTGLSYATGALAASHVPGAGFWAGGELETRVTTLSPHGNLVHGGTAPHEIRPLRAPNLIFFWPKAGGVVHRKSVQHPGTMAVPYMAEALESTIKTFD